MVPPPINDVQVLLLQKDYEVGGPKIILLSSNMAS